MQLYVLNRARETLETTAGVYDDKHTLTLDAGSSTYEFTIAKTDPASQCMDTGNYIVLQDDNGKNWVFTILDYEENQYTKTVYAEDVGIELLNKNCDIWKSEGPHSFEWYFSKVVNGTPWKLGVNQLAGLERTLTYEGRDTGLGRLLSILTAFDHAECKMDVSFTANHPCDFVVNVYKTIGADRSDVQIVYNHELDNITKKESRAQFVTALCGVGGTVTPPEGQETAEQENIDFADFEYNKDGLVTTKGDKFLRAVDANKRFNPGQTSYIESYYTYDTQSASELLNRTITQLKTYSEPQYTYTADVKVIDSTLEIGDTVTIIDHDYNPALYLSARVAKLEKSYTDPAQNTIEFCNYKLLNSQLSKLNELQNIVSKLPSASQVAKLESNVADLSSKTDELTSQITSANGKNTNYYGAVEPANPKNGDLWYKKLKSGETEMYQYQDGTWQLLASTADLTTVQTELDQAKSDMAQAKTDAQTAYDEAIKATNTANGAKAQTAEALKQVKQANDSYTVLAKEVAGNKTSVDTDMADIRKAIDANKASADADWKQAQKDYASVSGKLTETDKTVTDIKASTDADYQKAQAAIAQAQKDLSGLTGAVAEVKKGQGELSAKVAGKVDNTIYQTYVTQTNQSLSEKLVASDLSGYAKTVDVTKGIDGVKTTVADNTGKISTMQTDINGVKANVKNAQGDITSIKADVGGVKTTVSSNTGKITQLATDVNGVKTTVGNAQGDISSLQTDAKSIKATVSDHTGKISTINQTVDSVKTSVANAQGDIATVKADVSGTKQTVANAQKDITSIKTSVSGVQTDITNAKKDITSVKMDISGVKTSVSNVQGDVTSLKTTVSGVQTDVKNAKGDITSIKTDVSGVKTTIADHTGKITQLTTDVTGVKSSVSSKVDKTTYNSYVSQTDKALSAKLTASDLNGYAKTTDLEARAGKIEASLTSVNGKLDGLQIGGTNLLDDSEKERTKSQLANAETDVFQQKLVKAPTASTYFTVSFFAKASVDKTLIYNFLYDVTGKYNDGKCIQRWDTQHNPSGCDKDGATPLTLGTSYKKYYITWKLSQAFTLDNTHALVVGRICRGTTGATVSIRHVKLESGTKATDWCMSDNDFQSQLNTLSGKITATSDRLSSVYTKSETDAKLGTKVEQSVLTQTSNNLSASIAKNSKILASAGLVSDTAYINANKIALNGKTLMTNATINDAFIGNLSANKITTGTLNAAKVNLINVNASNISTGTLNGIKITSTGKDPSGTSSTTNIQSGYIDTNVINCSDYILVGKADPDPRKRWQTKQDSFGMWFTCPAKLNGHTGNSASDYQTEMQGFIGSDGWNYKNVAATGTGFSGIKLVLTPEQIWGRPYGGDQWSIGNWIKTENSNKSGDIRDGALDPVMWYSYTGQGAAYANQLVIQKQTQFFAKANFQDGVRIGVTGANHGIRTAWVSWSDWGSWQKVPCIVQDKDNWGGIAFPANGRTVLFTHDYRVSTSALPRDGGVYNGWGG